MSEFIQPREQLVTTDTSIECPVCKEFVELKLNVSIVIRQPHPDDHGASRVFIGLMTNESYNVHSCWPKKETL